MKTATWLALLAIGAILTLAVHADLPGVNLQVAGVIIMLTGVAGIFMPTRASGWLRRRVVLRGPAGPVIEEIGDNPYPPDVMRDPAALAARILRDAQAGPADPHAVSYLETAARYAEDEVVEAEEVVTAADGRTVPFPG